MLQRLKAAAVAAVMWLVPAAALAQSSPGLQNGDVPTMQQWNSYFAAKQDFLGTSPIPSGGGSFTGKVNFFSSTSGTAGMNCGVGTTPASPVNGDIWCTSVGMFVQINGSTVGPLGAGAGGTLSVSNGGTGQTTLTAGGVLVGNGTSPVSSYARSGTATTIATASGTLTNGHCVSINGTGDFVDAGGACTTGGGGGTVSSSTIGQVAVYSGATIVTGIAACNSGYYGTDGAGAVSCRTSLLAALQATITQVGTLTSGIWGGTIISPTFGGTGVNNGSFGLILGAGNLTTAGAAITLTAIGATNVTFPTSGVLMNQNGTSGGIPYYNTSTTVQSSAALTANLPVFGGGAGSSPFSGTRLGNTTKAQMANAATTPVTNDCVSYDANGNTQDSGQPCGSANAAPVLLATLTAPSGSPVTSFTDVGNCSTSGSTGCFTSTYTSYRIDFINVTASSPANNIGCQIAVWNGSYQATGYITSTLQGNTVGAVTPTTYIPCWPTGQSGAGQLGAPGISGSITVFAPSAVAKAQWSGTFVPTTGAGNATVTVQTVGWWNTSAALTGFRVCVGTAGGTCSGNLYGTIKVYGLP